MAVLNFDVNSVPTAEGFPEPKPAGWYAVIMTSSELRATVSGNGSKLHSTFKIIEGSEAGGSIFVNINWENPSEQAQQIGRGKIGAIAKALGITSILTDSSQLHDKPFMLKLNYQEAQGNYSAQNDIGAAKPMDVSQQLNQYNAPATQSPINSGMSANIPISQMGSGFPAQTQPGQQLNTNMVPQQNIAQTVVPNQVQQFDPNTGKPIGQNPPVQQFDPNTGQPINQQVQNFNSAEITESQDKPAW